MTILLFVLIIIAIPFVLAIFTSKEYSIIRTITVNRSREDVFNYIKFLKNGEQYNKWVMTDPGMKKEFRGTDGTIGFVYAWDSENSQVGKGEQEIIQITENERVAHEIRFIKPFASTSSTYMTTRSLPGGETELTWGFIGGLNYMMRIMHMLMNFKKILGKDIEISLGRLKANLETK